jgi:hypothetical protein
MTVLKNKWEAFLLSHSYTYCPMNVHLYSYNYCVLAVAYPVATRDTACHLSPRFIPVACYGVFSQDFIK